MPITVFSQQQPEPVFDHPRAERRVRGNPLRTTHTHYVSADGQLDCGVWACEPGAWRIVFADSKEEFFCVLQGRVRLSDEAGLAVEIGPGEAAVIPAGFRGVFEVLEPVRKYFVVRERP